MQIACPACAASYQVPDAMIGEGRQMRCVRCGEEWFATRPAPMPIVTMAEPTAPPPASAPPTNVVEEAPAPSAAAALARPRRSGPGLLLAWLASIAAWAGGLYGLWVMREPLMELWPPIVRLYALVGAV